MTCHNSRRGRRNDDNFDATLAAGDVSRAPHGSAQSDVIMGENAYLVETGIRGNHSLIVDTCANCHMVQTPPPDLLSYNNGGTNHTFSASPSVCANCHTEALTAAGVQAPFTADMTRLKAFIEDAILQLITSLTNDGNTVNISGKAITDASTIASIDYSESRGRQAITVTFTDESVVGPAGMNRVSVTDPAGIDLGEIYSLGDDRLPRAGWNYNLVNNDGSKGVHNPTFTRTVLDASIDAVIEILGH